MNNKLRVVWICHFSNEMIRNKLPLSNIRSYCDFAPWITNTIKGFEALDNLELHVISPHRGLKKFIYYFESNRVNYYFFKPDLPYIHRNWPSFLPVDKWTGYIQNRYVVHHFVNRIKPDLINLHGAENPYYSSTIFGLEKYPVYVCVQGIYSDPEHLKMLSHYNDQRIKIERNIYKRMKYFGVRAAFMQRIIKEDNPEAIFLSQYYPITRTIIDKTETKKYDFVFFARLSPAKGIEDLIVAIKIIKQFKPDVSLNVIGPGSHYYLKQLKKEVKKLGIEKNITFSGVYETMKELHNEVIKAKVSVLPTKTDTIPGTILESILLGLPVVTYNVGGIPFLNKKGQSVLVSEVNDIKGLANNMLKVLNSNTLQQKMVLRASRVVNKEFADDVLAKTLLEQYKAIVDYHNHNIDIPDKLMFDEDFL